jgi:hypothetical protein
VTVIGAISASNSAGLLLALGAEAVHALLADAVALGHLLGGLHHVPVDLGLLGVERRVLEHVQVHLVLHAGDALDAAGHVDLALAGHDALCRQCDRLQPARAEAVDGHAGHSHRQPGG